MPAKKGNTYAEKYDLETARGFFKDSLEMLKGSDDITFIGTLAVRMNTYRDLYYHLLDRFDDEELHTYKSKIDSILESRVVNLAMSGKANATFSIFMMKNNHGWRDKQEHEHSGGFEIKTSEKSKKKIDEIGND